MYIGRFAPTPSGGLHFGSLVAALASFLDAKNNGGKWLLRIEDLDFPRNKAGADKLILKQLEAYQLYWDCEVVYQSQRLDIYAEILDDLKNKQLIYACNCTRKQIGTGAYAGFCRQKKLAFDDKTAWRLKLNLDATISWEDGFLGKTDWRLAALGDPILKRKDSIIAYQLAVVVDDHLSRINNVVRGADLLSSTAWQICIYEKLNWRLPKFAHINLVLGEDGKKLSKQNLATEISLDMHREETRLALEFLGLNLNADFFDKKGLIICSQADILKFAINNWQAYSRTAINCYKDKK